MNNTGLKNHQQFEQILKDYHMTEELTGILADLKLVLMLAPTSTGRNTVIRQLLTTGSYHYIVSDTTRQPRSNDGVMEKNGTEYWFRSEEEVLADLSAGLYLEAELLHNQQVSGISLRELKKAKVEQKIAITDIDLEGVHNILRIKSDTIAVMLIPPSFEEWMRRITQRGAMSAQEFSRRLETASRIFEDGLQQKYYHFVIAEEVKHSASLIDAVARGRPNPYQDRAPELIHQLQTQLQDKLNSLTTSS